ncbi:hypothetical protein FA15DRAFT_597069 [Coprinopsis marcescibilis]|uniref:Peptidase M43 pregnancy-associated plasma-A domain-containing protein n=1 Tax=Coprinopsis marcescibilis TaxID=230819 RepID=A0A5C3KNG7_COPMA|nr:hypothetical protein FA15DRAFT_597069 [Coprinopsis marcescibilis]
MTAAGGYAESSNNLIFFEANLHLSYCGFVVTPDEVNSSERKFARMRRTQRAAGDDLDPITIPVHFHVIAANETMEGGWVHDSQLQLSIDILNRDYATAMITWELAEITRTINEEWFTSANIWPQAQIDLAQEMKSELRAGDEGDLNVYTVGFVKEAKEVEGLLGVATFPSNYTETPMEDGIMMKYSTLPGGVNPTYNRGFVLTHEAGHWVGLYHTFQGGCEGDGDLVDDTPAQGGPSRVTFQGGCVPTDTCENLPGVDLISNFMDYSEELCKSTTFTDGQIRRMRDELSAFRGYD